MKVRELLRLLFWPLVGLCILVGAQAFFAHYTEGMSKLLDYINGIIDMREERTIGTWFETLLFALTGITFFLVSRHSALQKLGKTLLVLAALGFCFLSADEMLSLHEFMGFQLEEATGVVKDTRLAHCGYLWVIIYGPGAITLACVLFGSYRRMTKPLLKKTAFCCFLFAWAAIELVVLCEMIAGWSILEKVDLSVVPCIEESLELVFIMLFYIANLLIAENADL